MSKSWNDFHLAVLSLFTSEYFDRLNHVSDGITIFQAVDGKLCYRDISLGSQWGYYGGETDSFELISKTDDTISVQVIGHYYSDRVKQTNDNGETEYINTGDYTVSYPISMIKIDAVGVFQSFPWHVKH
jgi:hypothetical protein